MTVALADAMTDTCGGKAGTLGALLRAGLRVPDGFVVLPSATPSTVRAVLARALEACGDGPVAVRSSASDEDTATSSAAGRYASILGVRGVDHVAAAVAACRSARSEGDQAGDGVRMAVLVQRLVDAELSGVMFTPGDPDGETRIEASLGLGPSVVEGAVTPDAYRVDRAGAVVVRIGDKRTRLDRRGDQLVTTEVAIAKRGLRALGDETVRRLAQLGHRIASLRGAPQDIEWAIVDEQVWVLQARPITAPVPAATDRATGPMGELVLSGTPGSSGAVTGPVRIVRGPTDFPAVRPGDIIVCPYTDPAWVPLLRLAVGVVTETGGVLSHAAIIARERRVPAVVGVTSAMSRLVDGARVTIDGHSGTVTQHPATR